ncbi:glyoxalase superfamily protein [Shimia ponticola]|uniref:glyoxalase superfamily protein n=1 Tax=Shimia ponticola TaxID=2582893 RepID=UPI0011BF3739|nr:glyoxalase superfamily protein [Shimia ponticola]
MTTDLPSLAAAKQQAKRLRAKADTTSGPMSHAQALEAVAQQHGFRDWNALYAAIRDVAPKGWAGGDRVSGSYLSQPFTASVRQCEALKPGWYRLVLDLDEAIDVVRFESFSNLRKQIRVDIGPDGYSRDRTSDGAPHAEIDL